MSLKAKVPSILVGFSGLAFMSSLGTLLVAICIGTAVVGTGGPLCIGLIGGAFLGGFGFLLYRVMKGPKLSNPNTIPKEKERWLNRMYMLMVANTMYSALLIVVGALALAGVLTIPGVNVAIAAVVTGLAVFSLITTLVIPFIKKYLASNEHAAVVQHDEMQNTFEYTQAKARHDAVVGMVDSMRADDDNSMNYENQPDDRSDNEKGHQLDADPRTDAVQSHQRTYSAKGVAPSAAEPPVDEDANPGCCGGLFNRKQDQTRKALVMT